MAGSSVSGLKHAGARRRAGALALADDRPLPVCEGQPRHHLCPGRCRHHCAGKPAVLLPRLLGLPWACSQGPWESCPSVGRLSCKPGCGAQRCTVRPCGSQPQLHTPVAGGKLWLPAPGARMAEQPHGVAETCMRLCASFFHHLKPRAAAPHGTPGACTSPDP